MPLTARAPTPGGYANSSVGMTGNPPADIATGGGLAVATNVASGVIAGGGDLTDGWIVPAFSKVIMLAFQYLKGFAWLNHQRHAMVILLMMGVGIGLGVAIFKHDDIVKWIARGGMMAWQATVDYASWRTTGIGGLPPAATFEDHPAESAR